MKRNELDELIGKSPPEGHSALIKEYGSYVYAIVSAHLRSCAAREDIEECVSDVFAEVIMNYRNSDFYSGDLKNSVGTVAKRRAVNYYNRISKNRSRHTELDENSSAADDIEADAEQNDMRKKLLDCISSLGKPDSEILLMKYYYGFRSKEIAERLSMSTANVQKRSERAVKKLKSMLENAGIGRDDYA